MNEELNISDKEAVNKALTLKYLLLGVGILLMIISGILAWWFISHKSKAQRKKPIALIPKVQVQEMKTRNIKVEIPATGLVIPAQEATIRARVAGEIIKLHDDLEPGGIFQKGDSLIWLDDKDFKLKVQMKKAVLNKAEAALQLELVQQRIAQSQLNTYRNKDDNTRLDKDMILRKPQERSSRADIQIAQSELDDAQLDLERTVIKAPFNSVVLEENIDLGEQADLQRVLVTLAGVDSFWVKVSIPIKYLQWIVFPSRKNPEGSKVSIISRRGTRSGRVLRRYTQLESQGRMAQILVEVKDPLGLKDGNGKPALLVGEYVKIKIYGKELKDVVAISRKAFRDDVCVWILNPKNKLNIVDVNPVWTLRDTIFVKKSALPPGRIIVSDLGFPVKNMSLSAAADRSAKKVVAKKNEAEKAK